VLEDEAQQEEGDILEEAGEEAGEEDDDEGSSLRYVCPRRYALDTTCGNSVPRWAHLQRVQPVLLALVQNVDLQIRTRGKGDMSENVT